MVRAVIRVFINVLFDCVFIKLIIYIVYIYTLLTHHGYLVTVHVSYHLCKLHLDLRHFLLFRCIHFHMCYIMVSSFWYSTSWVQSSSFSYLKIKQSTPWQQISGQTILDFCTFELSCTFLMRVAFCRLDYSLYNACIFFVLVEIQLSFLLLYCIDNCLYSDTIYRLMLIVLVKYVSTDCVLHS